MGGWAFVLGPFGGGGDFYGHDKTGFIWRRGHIDINGSGISHEVAVCRVGCVSAVNVSYRL
jgi:hypothetical protein